MLGLAHPRRPGPSGRDVRGDIHDVPQFAGGRPVVVATYQKAGLALRGLAGPEVVFRAPWEPCSSHVNCVATAGGRPYATALVGDTDHPRWREREDGAGLLVELPNGRPVATGLDAAHNPLHVPEGWLACNSGAGELLLRDPDQACRAIARADVGGWCRGLAVSPDHFYVGISAPRTTGALYGGNAGAQSPPVAGDGLEGLAVGAEAVPSSMRAGPREHVAVAVRVRCPVAVCS